GLALQTGRLRWQTSAAQRPLLIHDNRLFAAELVPGQANVLRVRSLDLEDPQQSPRPTSDIVFAPWVDVADGEAFTFDVYGAEEEVVLQWRARRRYRGGAPPPAEIQQALPRELVGTARLHIDAGVIKMTNNETPRQAAALGTELKSIPFKLAS